MERAPRQTRLCGHWTQQERPAEVNGDARIRAIQNEARRNGFSGRPAWPAIVLRTPKGWTGPKEVDGLPVEGTFRAHQVPLPHARENPTHLRMLKAWMRSYRPQELFDGHGRLIPVLTALSGGLATAAVAVAARPIVYPPLMGLMAARIGLHAGRAGAALLGIPMALALLGARAAALQHRSTAGDTGDGRHTGRRPLTCISHGPLGAEAVLGPPASSRHWTLAL